MWGTHTHVATADCRILGGHTGFITDLGMVGSADGILGVKSEAVLHKFLVKTPVRFETEHGNEGASGALFTVDCESGKCISAGERELLTFPKRGRIAAGSHNVSRIGASAAPVPVENGISLQYEKGGSVDPPFSFF